MEESSKIASILPATILESVPFSPTDAERHKPLAEWYQKEYPGGICVHQMFEMQVQRTPEAVAVVFENKQLSYRELNERAERLANRLRNLGVVPESLVGLFVERSLEMMVGLLGILKAGGAYVPMDPRYPQERLAFMLEDARPVAILTQQSLLERLPTHQSQIVCLDLLDSCASESKNPRVNGLYPQASNLAYVLFTSGSTGRPKGVQITHRSLINLLVSMQSEPGFSKEDTVLAVTTLSFDIAGVELFLPLTVGARVVIASADVAMDGAALVSLMERSEATFMQATPATWRLLLEAGWIGNSKLKILCGGEAWPASLAAKLLPKCKSLWNMYGPTETTIWSAAAQVESGQPVLIGNPIAKTTFYVLDDLRHPVPVGAAGELYIGGDGVARGYLNRPDLTSERFVQNPFSPENGARLFKSGDLVRLLPSGKIEFLCRVDQQVKIRGFRIELGEVEAVLSQHPSIRECVVIARENKSGEKDLAAYLTVRDRLLPAITELRVFLLNKLPDYMIPAVFVILPALPLTPNGKIDRKALPSLDEHGFARRVDFTAPVTATEKLLAEIWCEVLGVNEIGINENFFELGGHSLMAVRIIFRMRDLLKTELPVKAISEFPTVSELGRAVDKAGKVVGIKSSSRPVRLDRSESAAPQTFVASFGQEQLWLIDQLEPESPVYNIPLAIYLRGQLDQQALQASIDHLIQRHEVLRTTFLTENGVPVQVVAPQLAINLTVVSLGDVPEAKRGTEALRLMLKGCSRPFNLHQAPLMRAELFVLDGQNHILLLTIHHIVFDGWSVNILVRDLAASYTAICRGQIPKLPDLPYQFADFSTWQRDCLTTEKVERHIGYWRKQLAGVPMVLELPTDRPRPRMPHHSGAHHRFTLSADLTDSLRELGRQHGTTLFVTLLAAFQTLLYRYAGQQVILVGSPMSGRTLKESEDLIGFFVNALPLKADFSGNPEFAELLRQIHKTVWEALDHQELPFEKLVEELQPRRDMSCNPVFQAAFIFEDASSASHQMGDVALEWEELKTSTVKFDLTLSLIEKNGCIRGVMEYATGIFEAETIARLLKHFQNLVADIVANPRQRASNLRLLSDAERHQLLGEWNDTAADYPQEKCVHQLFEIQAVKTPEAVAVVCDDGQLTYRELNRRANQLAHRLRSLGVESNDLVGIYVERSLEIMVGLLGVLKAGGAYVPLDTKNPRSRLQQQLEGIKVFVTQTEMLPLLPAFAGVVVFLDRERYELARLSESNPELKASSENLAYVIYTSGSTGAPKGVAIRHRNLVNYAHFISWCLGLETFPNGLKFAVVSSIAADLGNTCIYPALLSGGSLHIISADLALNPDGFARYASRHVIDVLKITPSHLEALILSKNPQAILPRRFLILGGEVLTMQLVERIRELAGTCRIINHYGPTETTVGSLILGEEDFSTERLSLNANIPVGRPIANTQAYILDAHLQPVPIGVRGQLYIGGDGVALGYYNNLELTAKKFIQNPFISDPSSRLYDTGDLARYLPDGKIEFLGRNDYQVKIRGFRIELGEIETIIQKYPGIGQCVLVLQERAQGDNWLVAYLVLSEPQFPLAINMLRDFLQKKLPDYMIPAAFVSLEKLPLTSNGKIDRNALTSQDWNSGKNVRLQPVDSPSTPLELHLLIIWQRVLNFKTVGIRDNFFDLGGNSLLAVRLVSEINKSLNQSLSIPAFFRDPTIEGIARILEQENHANPEPKLIPLQGGSSARALFFLDASMGQCRLAQLLDTGITSFASIVPLPAVVLQAATRNETNNLPSLETLAVPYTALIQKNWPSGSCLLAGHSFGGLLAFEVAHQLQRQGRTVELILLMDSWAEIPPWWRKFRAISLTRARNSIQFRTRYWLSKIRRSMANAIGQPPVPPKSFKVLDSFSEEGSPLTGDVSWEIMEKIYAHARKNYRLHPLESRAIIFRARESEMAYLYSIDGNMGWDGLLAQGIKVVETPGNHFSLLKRPHLLTLAEHFNKCLHNPDE